MSFNHFRSALPESFKKQKNCDVTFSCDDPSSSTGKSTIKAHKYVLSLASDVFNTMFYGEAANHFKEKDKENNSGTINADAMIQMPKEEKYSGKINIDDIKMPTFKLFLSFIYNNLVDIETTETAAEFYYAAHKYNAIDALEFINTYMLKKANSENAILFYDIASLYENQELKDACIKIFSENSMDVIKSLSFLKADPKIIELIYKLDALNIYSEVKLINALECYIDHNKANDPDIAEKARPALSHIRFLTLTAPVIAKTTLLNSEDSLAVIGYLASGATISKMPTFLSTNNQKRVFTISVMEIMRKLSTVFSVKYCNYCIINNKSDCIHAFWNCPLYGSNIKVKNIYEKYNHVWLLDYNVDDVKAVYEAYKSLGFVR